MAIPWATNLLHFHLSKPFINMAGINWVGSCFGYFSKNWAIFFQIIWSPCLPGLTCSDNYNSLKYRSIYSRKIFYSIEAGGVNYKTFLRVIL
jgi:hypothetical protein